MASEFEEASGLLNDLATAAIIKKVPANTSLAQAAPLPSTIPQTSHTLLSIAHALFLSHTLAINKLVPYHTLPNAPYRSFRPGLSSLSWMVSSRSKGSV